MNKTQVLLVSVAVLATFTIAQPSTHAAKYAPINWMENSDLTTVHCFLGEQFGLLLGDLF